MIARNSRINLDAMLSTNDPKKVRTIPLLDLEGMHRFRSMKLTECGHHLSL